MRTACPTCCRPLTENDRCEIKGALCYHVGCAPTSAAAPRSIWQALRQLCGCH